MVTEKREDFIIAKRNKGDFFVLDYPEHLDGWFNDCGFFADDCGFIQLELLENEKVGAYAVICNSTYDDGGNGLVERSEGDITFAIVDYTRI